MPEEKITTSRMGELDAYLVEARSIGGLSGSPVFCDFGRPGTSDNGTNSKSGLHMIGIVHGHWDIGDGASDVVDQDALVDGRSVNMGIAYSTF